VGAAAWAGWAMPRQNFGWVGHNAFGPIDVKNINLQIKKNIKKRVFLHLKTLNKMDKNIKVHYPFK